MDDTPENSSESGDALRLRVIDLQTDTVSSDQIVHVIRGKDFDFHEELPVKQPQGNFTVALPQGLQDAEVNLDTTLYYCPDKSTTPAVCHIKSYRFSQPISLSAAAADSLLTYRAALRP